MYDITLTWSDGFIENYEIHRPSDRKLMSEVNRIDSLVHVIDYVIKQDGKILAQKGINDGHNKRYHR